MARKTLEERIEEAKRIAAEARKKQRLFQAELNKKNRKIRNHQLILNGVLIESALNKLNKPLDTVSRFSQQEQQLLAQEFANILERFLSEHPLPVKDTKSAQDTIATTSSDNSNNTESASSNQNNGNSNNSGSGEIDLFANSNNNGGYHE